MRGLETMAYLFALFAAICYILASVERGRLEWEAYNDGIAIGWEEAEADADAKANAGDAGADGAGS